MYSFFRNETESETTEHLKDSYLKMVLVGYCIPIMILGVVVVNFVLGKAFMPADRFRGDLLDGLVQSYALGWQFIGIVVGKVGLAAALFSWYILANLTPTERWAQPALLASIVVILIGLIIYGVGFFV